MLKTFGTAYVLNSVGDFDAKSTSRVKHTEFSNDYLSSHVYSRNSNPVLMKLKNNYVKTRLMKHRKTMKQHGHKFDDVTKNTDIKNSYTLAET